MTEESAALVLALGGLAAFWAAELALRREAARSFQTTRFERGSTLLVLGCNFGSLALALAARPLGLPGRVAGTASLVALGAALAAGVALRWWAMRVLGAHFTRTLRTAPGQGVVDRGPYIILRHPGYAAQVLVVGAASALLAQSWLAGLAAAGVVSAGYAWRTRAEEEMLRGVLGEPYARYAARTWGWLSPALAAWLVLAAAHLAVAASAIRLPGPFYDEVIQAVPAQDFLRGAPRASVPVHTLPLLGRAFPYKTQTYMGALKSQLLIPSFALLGDGVGVLRATTTSWALLGVLLVMLFAERALGSAEAVIAGALLALDPSLLFVARHDWGSASLALLCKGAGLLLVAYWCRTRGAAALAAAGLVLGLGIYNKIDFAVGLAGLAGAALVCWPGTLRDLSRRHARAAALALALLAAAGAPVLLAALEGLGTSGAATASPLAERLRTALAALDGTYFHRLLVAGGRFDQMFAVPGPPASPLGPLALLAGVGLLVVAARSAGARARVGVFLVVAGALTQLGLLAFAVPYRVHHELNVHPLPHLVVAAGALAGWRAASRLGETARTAARAGVAGALAAVLAADLASLATTRGFLERTGGRGYWSDATYALASDLDGRAQGTALSLGWGIHAPLAFLTARPRLDEPFWQFSEQSRRAWRRRGSAQDVYLFYAEPYDHFGYGGQFLRAIRALDPARVELRSYADREGAPVLLAARILADHDLAWRGDFRIRLRGGAPGARVR